MSRSDLVLAVLAAGGQGISFEPVQVQKLFFLIDRELHRLVDGPHFNFRPYDYGPFDSAVYSELEKLRNEQLVAIAEGNYRSYSLTQAGYERGEILLGQLPERARDFIQQTVKWMRSLSFSQLVAWIYKRYPDMKTASVFRE